jgi:integrase
MASTRERNGRFTGLYRDQDGKQKSAGTFDSREEALARATVAELDANPAATIELPALSRRGRLTVAGHAPGWLASQILEETSRESYANAVKRIVAHLGGMTRDDVGPEDVRKMLKALEKSGLADATIACTLVVARSLLGKAACDGVQYKIRDQKEMLVATRAQARLIEAAIDPRYKLLVRALFATGCRWGEMIAIRGTDVERRGSGYVLRIRRVVVQVTDSLHERPYGKSPKAKRDISIPEDLALELVALGNNLCFTNARGRYLRRSDFRSGYWKPAVEAAGLPALRVHDTRHSHCSWLVNDGRVSLARVRDRMGHSSISTTNRYVHVMPGDEDPCLAVLGEAA